MNNTQEVRVEECRKALESCPHDHGTVKAICRVCLGRDEFWASSWDNLGLILVNCPRYTGEICHGSVEVCPCLEDFSPETIAKAVENLRAESRDQQQDDAQEDSGR